MKEKQTFFFVYFFFLVLIGFAAGIFSLLGPVHEFGHHMAYGGNGEIVGWCSYSRNGVNMPDYTYFIAGYLMELFFLLALSFVFCFSRRWWIHGFILGHGIESFIDARFSHDINTSGPKYGYSFDYLWDKFLDIAIPLFLIICLVISIDILARLGYKKKAQRAECFNN